MDTSVSRDTSEERKIGRHGPLGEISDLRLISGCAGAGLVLAAGAECRALFLD